MPLARASEYQWHRSDSPLSVCSRGWRMAQISRKSEPDLYRAIPTYTVPSTVGVGTTLSNLPPPTPIGGGWFGGTAGQGRYRSTQYEYNLRKRECMTEPEIGSQNDSA